MIGYGGVQGRLPMTWMMNWSEMVGSNGIKQRRGCREDMWKLRMVGDIIGDGDNKGGGGKGTGIEQRVW